MFCQIQELNCCSRLLERRHFAEKPVSKFMFCYTFQCFILEHFSSVYHLPPFIFFDRLMGLISINHKICPNL